MVEAEVTVRGLLVGDMEEEGAGDTAVEAPPGMAEEEEELPPDQQDQLTRTRLQTGRLESSFEISFALLCTARTLFSRAPTNSCAIFL